MEIFFGIIILLIYFSIFFFGYKKDYQRNPKEFIKTIIGMPTSFLLGLFGVGFLDEKIKKWTKK
ncbi:hypothetical protein [Polaribacter sargassicola]|uniref:hypothetical protein n=1 Tax=Polaribacter sargassicola TaxID=2836891 RepID=UPI001F48832B|nr:hypothetical protein [Polaribacter sp. DS7-9]MCG1037629.1 hypothetical protein [Polaribacter sp. DS7-9]